MMRLVARYAGALAAAAPLAFSAPAFAQETAQQTATQDVELIGTVTGMVEVDRPTCPPAYDCINSTYRVTLAEIQQLTGPPLEGAQSFTISLHSAYQPGVILRLTVRDTGADTWQVMDQRIMGFDEDFAAALR